MSNIPFAYLLFNMITGCLCLSLGALLYLFHGPSIFKPASQLMFVFWLWLLTELLEYFSPALNQKILFNNLQFIATGLLPVVWISFCFHIRKGYSLFDKKRFYLLYLYPLIIVTLVFTNHFHQLLWTSVSLLEGDYAISKNFKPLFSVIMIFSFLMIILGIGLLISRPIHSLKQGGLSRTVILLLSCLPLMTSYIEWRDDYSLPFELTPLTLSFVAISALFYIRNNVRSQLLLNKYNILSTLKEPLFLVETTGLIMFANDSAIRLSGLRETQFYNTPIEDIIPPLKNLKEGVIFHDHLFFSVNINTVLREKDKILAVSLTEVTALKDSEISLKHLTDELENQVRNRTDRLNQSNHQLEKLVDEKNILLQEVHHRVNNNLQLIISLLNLQRSRIEEEHLKIYLKDAVARVQTIAMVHQMLYKSEDFSRINLKNYIEDLLHSMLKGPQEALELHLCDLICSTSTCIQIGMIVNEIVLNALKYAYTLDDERKPFFCSTEVERRKEGADRLHILFRDYGQGIIDSRQDIKSSESLGIRIIKTLVQQRNGELEIYNDNGCIYKMVVEL